MMFVLVLLWLSCFDHHHPCFGHLSVGVLSELLCQCPQVMSILRRQYMDQVTIRALVDWIFLHTTSLELRKVLASLPLV